MAIDILSYLGDVIRCGPCVLGCKEDYRRSLEASIVPDTVEAWNALKPWAKHSSHQKRASGGVQCTGGGRASRARRFPDGAVGLKIRT